jgi:hypothetical protein
MSDRTFRLILDGKKGGLVKGSSPSSAAKKVGFYTNSVKTGKSSIKFELQETTKGSKKKIYGPYKTKVKMAGGGHKNNKPSWDTPFEQYFPKGPVISKNSLERQLQDLYNLQKKFKNKFGPENTQFNAEIANLQEQIRIRDSNVTRSIANKEGQQISALYNKAPQIQNRKFPFSTGHNSLPTVSSVQAYKNLGKAEQRASQKATSLQRNAARNAKSPPFNNS